MAHTQLSLFARLMFSFRIFNDGFSHPISRNGRRKRQYLRQGGQGGAVELIIVLKRPGMRPRSFPDGPFLFWGEGGNTRAQI